MAPASISAERYIKRVRSILNLLDDQEITAQMAAIYIYQTTRPFISRKREPSRQSVYNVVQRAKADGTLVPGPCKQCGAEPTVAHHTDYNKPLDVEWLCPSCHTKMHHRHAPDIRQKKALLYLLQKGE